MVQYHMKPLMTKKFRDKIKLYLIIHGIKEVYVLKNGSFTSVKPNDFEGKGYSLWGSGFFFQANYKDGEQDTFEFIDMKTFKII